MLKSFEHVGMTVSDMDRCVNFYCGLLGLRLHLRKRMADGAEIAFLDAGGGMLQIFSRRPVAQQERLTCRTAWPACAT